MTLAHTLAAPPFNSFNVTTNPWLPQSSKAYTEEEKTLSKELLGLWITFIRTDNPNSQNRFRGKYSDRIWPEFAQPQSNSSRSLKKFNQFSSRDHWVFVLKANGTNAVNSYHSDECDIWKSIDKEFSEPVVSFSNFPSPIAS